MQFADNVSRSRRQLNPTASAASTRRSLPPASARVGRAHGVASRARHSPGEGVRPRLVAERRRVRRRRCPEPGAEPELWAEDLIRGWRIDVSPGRDAVAFAARSHRHVPPSQQRGGRRRRRLQRPERPRGSDPHRRRDDQGWPRRLARPVHGRERGASGPAGASAPGCSGLTIGADDEIADPDANPTDPDFGIKAALRCRRAHFPRSGSGASTSCAPDRSTSRTTARASTPTPTHGPDAISPPHRYHRYEPVQPPDIVLRDPSVTGREHSSDRHPQRRRRRQRVKETFRQRCRRAAACSSPSTTACSTRRRAYPTRRCIR